MQRLSVALLAGIWMSAMAASQGGAQSPEAAAPRAPIVVELFTSQGCAYCPPADALLAELARRPDVLPLALHVDYWDYIGWKDEFAHAAFTARQKEYARQSGRGMVYTPQMIVAGRIEIPGYKPARVLSSIELEKDRPSPVRIDITPGAEGSLTVRLTPISAIEGPARVVLVRFRPQAEVEIARGENAGKSMVYTNIVTQWTVLGVWDGQGPGVFAVPGPGEVAPMPGAVLVQEEGPGAVLSAARLD